MTRRTLTPTGVSLRRTATRLELETLESRTLPTATAGPLLPSLADVDAADTLDRAVDLSPLSAASGAVIGARLGDGANGAADVDWYHFTLDRATLVRLTSSAGGDGSLVSVLSLYRSSPFDPNHLSGEFASFDDLQHRLRYDLVVQAEGTADGGSAHLERSLAAGSYYVAISGSGNRFFNPFLAGSGYPGSTGLYQLQVSALVRDLRPGDGPVVLAADPAPDTALDHSPLVLRVDLNAPLDPASINLNNNVQLILSPTGRFGDGQDRLIPLARSYMASGANELQLLPGTPLAPGSYRVFLAGNSSAGGSVLADRTGAHLGASAGHPLGEDYTFTFQVVGSEGKRTPGAGANDTPASAHELGDLTPAAAVQITGLIGDDPTDPVPFNPGDVDLYHFQVSGPGRYAVSAEVFAGRIGSPLDPALSLFRYDAARQQYQLMAANDNTLNDLLATDGKVPLLVDSLLFAGLTAGDYYLAVSGSNVLFDVTMGHRGQGGLNTGHYVLNVLLEPDNVPPQVVSVTPADSALLTGPPTRWLVQFNERVNVGELALRVFNSQDEGRLDAVFIQAADGHRYFPRLYSFDLTTQVASFGMYDRLPNGTYAFHLSGDGTLGITDWAGNSLAGNSLPGDYVTHFTVNGPAVGTQGNPRLWTDQEPNDDISQPQQIGVLFPEELVTGVTVARDFTGSPGQEPSDSADCYAIRVLQPKTYFFGLSASGLPAGVMPQLFDASGAERLLLAQAGGGLFQVNLEPGRYVIRLGGWSPAQAAGVKYQLQITIAQAMEEAPPPLTIGAAPAVRFRVLGGGPGVVAPAPAAPGSNGSGGQTALLPSSQARPFSDRSQDFLDMASIPSGVLVAMGTRPAGATGDGPATSLSPKLEVLERVFAQAPEIFLGEQLLRVTVLTQVPRFESGDSSLTTDSVGWHSQALPEEALSAVLKTGGASVQSAWDRAVELFHFLWNMPERPVSQTRNLRSDEASEANAPGDDDAEQTVATNTGFPENGTLSVLVATATLAAALGPRPSGNRPKVQRQPSELEGKERESAPA